MYRLLVLFVLLVSLSACGGEIITDPGPTDPNEPTDPFADAERVTATNDPLAELAEGVVTDGNPDYYEIRVPNDLDDSLIYFEAGTSEPLTLTLYNANGTAVRVSNSERYFALPGNLLANGLETQAIEIGFACRGPCIIVNKGDGTVFLRVATSSNLPVEYTLYAYSDPYRDSTEPANNDCGGIPGTSVGTAAIVVTPDGYVGAIETIEDVDCFTSEVAVSNVSLETVAANDAVQIVAKIYDVESGQLYGTASVGPGESSEIVTVPNRPVDIRVVSGNGRAGPVVNSQYSLNFNQ